MNRKIALFLLIALSLLISAGGCDKERIVESTEYVHDIEYIQLPPDTVFMVDTVSYIDSVMAHITDTVTIIDTVVQVNHLYDTTLIYDTVVTVENHYDTVVVYDTVVSVENHYDTTAIVDTVLIVRCEPNEYLAIAALHYYSDQLVLDYIYQGLGYDDGWIFYLSSFQLDLTAQSSDTYDIYGYIDYWAPDWSGYYPLEFYWRMIYTGGDPANVNNWDIEEPPNAAGDHFPGIRLTPKDLQAQRILR